MIAPSPVVVFDHLEHLTDAHGLFEHALHTTPRREHGYCVDDAARGVVVLCREPSPDRRLRRLLRCYLNLVVAAVERDGRCHNRMGADGTWQDEAGTGDWWGRAIWALGTAATSGQTPGMRTRARVMFHRAAQARSPHAHAMAFAALGAAQVLGRHPRHRAARALLIDAVDTIGPVGPDAEWPWPEPRLRYGNAALAEALIVAGDALDEPGVVAQGTRMLAMLLETETRDGHLSVTPVGGRGRDDMAPGFDQQPIEVAAIADACVSAYRVTAAAEWLGGVRLAWSWFLGDNDSATAMFDPLTGGGYDGLERTGRNSNQGAESTLAMLATAQQARHLVVPL